MTDLRSAMRHKLASLVRRAAGTEQLQQRVCLLEQHTATTTDAAATFPLPNWWERSFWEPTVALAIRDHCRPGDVVFDVGANAGALSMMMSRLVGPRGIVCAFEASPRIIDKTHYNLVRAGCSNVTLFHKAVWHTSGSLVNIAAGSHLNDRIDETATGMAVRTVALDDFAAAADFRPSFIKMDIEGAEFDALRGMGRLLREVRPCLGLEPSPEDMRCHELLTAAGYLAVDLASYRRVRTKADFSASIGVANVLFGAREMVLANPYFDDALPATVATLGADRFTIAPNGDVSMSQPLQLPPGRYIVRANFLADGTENEIFAGVEADGEAILRYHTYTRFMAESYADWPVQLDHPAHISPYLRFLRGTDPGLRWKGVEVLRVSAFDKWSPPIIE
jgi:FkbM family methyltransferase